MSEHPKIERNTGEDSGATDQPRTEANAPPRPTSSDWQAAAAKELKGKDVTWHTVEGIAVKPLYTAEDTANLDPGLPGFAPFMVMLTDISSSGMPSNKICMSSSVSIATPALPTSPTTRG